jgi:hypothetical protein
MSEPKPIPTVREKVWEEFGKKLINHFPSRIMIEGQFMSVMS